MKNGIVYAAIVSLLLTSAGCGPVIVSHNLADPAPPWFYPNRIEMVRYVYFPELSIYYDLSARTYLYFDGGIWVRRRVLPPSYRSHDLNRSRYERIRDYYGDDIQRYHDQNNASKGRSNQNLQRKQNS